MKKDYWTKRFEQIEAAQNAKSTKIMLETELAYKKAMENINGKILVWYQRFADNNNITLAEAKKLLSAKELAELKWNVKEYIKYGKQNAIDKMWMKELENASARFHISRLEALRLECTQEIQKVMGKVDADLPDLVKNVYKDTYYHSCFELQKGVNVGFNVAKIDDRKLELLVNKPWATDGYNFSEKIWQNKTKTINTLDQSLNRMVITGEAPTKIISDFEKVMRTGFANAARLILTEQSYFTTLAQTQMYKDLDVQEVEIVATLDSVTCHKCGENDGLHYPINELEIGINAPPFHPRCRCTTCPYFSDMDGYRASRSEDGKTMYEVPVNMTYEKWVEEYVQ